MRLLHAFAIATLLVITIASDSFAIDFKKTREVRQIVINGVTEEWRLEWLSPPKPVCGPESARAGSSDPENWTYCPCNGFAFGEMGDLVLVRVRPGKKDERLRLKDFFLDGYFIVTPLPILRRWDTKDSDYDDKDKPGFVDMVKQRPLAQIMKFADYDNDGRATEFFIQTGSIACGKRVGIIVGISRDNPHLHAFSSAKNTKEPLLLYDHQWEALSRSQGRPVRVIDWSCGDHGSDTNVELELKAVKGKIFIKRRTYQCTESGKRGKLIEVTEETEFKQ